MITPHFLLHSNYNQWYYKLWYWAPPTNSSPDPEEHSYGPKDPRALQNKVINVVIKVSGEWGGVLFCGKTMVKISQWFHTLLCILNALKH